MFRNILTSDPHRLMIAPLRDSRGKIRYFIGAQVDVSGLVKDCTDLESLQQLVRSDQEFSTEDRADDKDDFRELSEMLNMAELDIVRKYGGRMHRDYCEDDPDASQSKSLHMPRLMLQEPSSTVGARGQSRDQGGKLSGIYQNVGPGSSIPRSGTENGHSTFSFDLIHPSGSCSLLQRYECLGYSNRPSWTRSVDRTV